MGRCAVLAKKKRMAQRCFGRLLLPPARLWLRAPARRGIATRAPEPDAQLMVDWVATHPTAAAAALAARLPPAAAARFSNAMAQHAAAAAITPAHASAFHAADTNRDGVIDQK
jgi:hypothetical protein